MDAASEIRIAPAITDLAWEAVRGGYDLQVHVTPEVIERRTDDVALAQEFLTRRLKGFVLKSHYVPTVERARAVERAVPGIVEHCVTTTHTNKASWGDVIRNVRQIGIERTILSTDLGQTINPPVAEGFAMYAQRSLDAGFSVHEIQHMVAVLPARLLDSQPTESRR